MKHPKKIKAHKPPAPKSPGGPAAPAFPAPRKALVPGVGSRKLDR